jgi:hypothetical protein
MSLYVTAVHGAAHAVVAVCTARIPFVKIGRKHLIDPADLRAFIQRSKAAA